MSLRPPVIGAHQHSTNTCCLVEIGMCPKIDPGKRHFTYPSIKSSYQYTSCAEDKMKTKFGESKYKQAGPPSGQAACTKRLTSRRKQFVSFISFMIVLAPIIITPLRWIPTGPIPSSRRSSIPEAKLGIQVFELDNDVGVVPSVYPHKVEIRY